VGLASLLPQLSTLERSVSQPSLGLAEQGPNPSTQTPKGNWHWPLTQGTIVPGRTLGRCAQSTGQVLASRASTEASMGASAGESAGLP